MTRPSDRADDNDGARGGSSRRGVRGRRSTKIYPAAHALQTILLDDAEEELWACGILGLYNFAWALRGLHAGVPENEFPNICRAAYEELRARHELQLVWVRWPMRIEEATPAADDTPLDFDLDPEAPVSTPMLALVPTDDAAAGS